jgi:ABC-type transport system involved in Fe-S cluster assembly fused permease/ATPase subunit
MTAKEDHKRPTFLLAPIEQFIMQSHSSAPPQSSNHQLNSADKSTLKNTSDWHVIKMLLPYLWEYRWRASIAMMFLIIAKLANIAVPITMKQIVDNLNAPQAVLAVPVTLLLTYGIFRLSSTLFSELRDIVFARVTQRAVRRIALNLFRHLHALSLRFHLERQTGGVSRDIERGTRGISTLMRFVLFSILPTVLEISLVTILLYKKFEPLFAIITLSAVAIYIITTVVITEWRTTYRRKMNDLDSTANTKAIDSLLNYETVKYFGNEEYEAKRYDQNLQSFESASVKNETSLGLLNSAQSCIIALAVSLIMWRCADGIVNHTMTIGDLVMVNGLLVQLYVPLGFLGVMYREIKQALADMEKMFSLMHENREIQDDVNAKPLDTSKGAAIIFDRINFGYDKKRQILFDASFSVEAGTTLAVVGSSGAGKSTLSRLLFRFYDVDNGGVLIDGQDIRHVTQSSLRKAIGIVPQDTVLFNDTIYYNIAYGKPDASREDIIAAAKAAHIHHFIESLPDGYETTVGERGLKLSGGEKQRVAIARTILKNPAILIFDEATSALDSKTEKAIQGELKEISANRTTLIIAHRLSTVVDANQILVMDQGRIIERGNFRELIQLNGKFAEMWQLQQEEDAQLAAEIRNN